MSQIFAKSSNPSWSIKEKCVELVLCKIELLGESFSKVESRWGKQSSEIRKAGTL